MTIETHTADRKALAQRISELLNAPVAYVGAPSFAYEIKTSLPRDQLSALMDAETWMNANKARELGFCDEILFTDEQQAQPHEGFFTDSFSFSRKAASACLLNKLKAHIPQPDNRVKAADLEKRLSLLKF